ncbi:MAG: glycosyltransferase family 4 protein [Candidatus Firestonebacteria bacterium]
MAKYNILYLHDAPYLGGAEKSLLTIVDNIDKSVFTPFFACDTKGVFAEELRKRNIICEHIDYAKIRILRGVRDTNKRLDEIINKYNINLLHGNVIRTNLYASMAGKRNKIPVVWHIRNLIYKELIDTEKWLIFLADAVFCNGGKIAERFNLFGKRFKRIKVIYTGIDTKRYNPVLDAKDFRREFGINPAEIVIMTVGRFGVGKGQEIFLNVAAILSKKHLNLKFMIVGGAAMPLDAWREIELKKLAENLNIKDKTIFTGFRKDIENMMACADLFILPSYFEPFGRVLLEAMASGKPVIATSSGGTPEIVTDGVTGLLVPPRDSEKLAEAIDKLITDPDLMKKLSLAGRERAEKIFDIKICIKTLENEYMKVLQK